MVAVSTTRHSVQPIPQKLLYILISLVMTGLAPWNMLGTADPMATALEVVQGRPGLSASSQHN